MNFMKKYDETNLINSVVLHDIINLVKMYPNDQELGVKVREYIRLYKKK